MLRAIMDRTGRGKLGIDVANRFTVRLLYKDLFFFMLSEKVYSYNGQRKKKKTRFLYTTTERVRDVYENLYLRRLVKRPDKYFTGQSTRR